MSTMTFQVGGRLITITAKMMYPDEAADLLSRNKRNRKLNPQRVAQLVNDIRDGAFKFNGDTIRLASTDGQYDDLLIDARHRLQACVDSGLPIPVIIVGNLDPDVSDTIDQGQARTVLTFADMPAIDPYRTAEDKLAEQNALIQHFTAS